MACDGQRVMAVFAIKTILILGLVLYAGGPLETAWRALTVDEDQGMPEKPVEAEVMAEAIPPCDATRALDCDPTRVVIQVSWPVDRASAMGNDTPRPEPQVLPPKPRGRVNSGLGVECPSLASASDSRDLKQLQVRKVSCTRLQQTAAEFFLTYRGSTE